MNSKKQNYEPDLPFEIVESEMPSQYLIYPNSQYPAGHIAEVHGTNAKENAEFIVRACNDYEGLRQVILGKILFLAEHIRNQAQATPSGRDMIINWAEEIIEIIDKQTKRLIKLV